MTYRIQFALVHWARGITTTLLFLFSCALCPSAADAAGNASRALALLEKFTPGMNYEQAKELLAEAAETHAVGGDKSLLRRAWLHGEFGVEIYFLNERAYRIDVLSYFQRDTEVSRALDEMLQLGRQRYGTLPQFVAIRNEYYWIAGGYRLSFCKSGAREMRLSRMAPR